MTETGGGVREPFTDLVSGAGCVLVVPAGGRVYPAAGELKAGVEHPGCGRLADLCIELDAFWCPGCRWSGRVSGAWCTGVLKAAAART